LLSENGDTLSNFTYPYECKKFGEILSYRNFIEISLGGCNPYVSKCYTYPIEVHKDEYSSAFIRYDEKGNISKNPSFWIYYRRNKEYPAYVEFVDSTGNVMRY
jgi:hypothetical protein